MGGNCQPVASVGVQGSTLWVWLGQGVMKAKQHQENSMGGGGGCPVREAGRGSGRSAVGVHRVGGQGVGGLGG